MCILILPVRFITFTKHRKSCEQYLPIIKNQYEVGMYTNS